MDRTIALPSGIVKVCTLEQFIKEIETYHVMNNRDHFEIAELSTPLNEILNVPSYISITHTLKKLAKINVLGYLKSKFKPERGSVVIRKSEITHNLFREDMYRVSYFSNHFSHIVRIAPRTWVMLAIKDYSIYKTEDQLSESIQQNQLSIKCAVELVNLVKYTPAQFEIHK